MFASRRKFLATLAAAPFANLPIAKSTPRSEPAGRDALQARLATDPLRPQCHLLPAKNWMNDPNGPIYWKGQYHMFFQYNPTAAIWGDMHWAHAASPDMIHWRHLPIALAPTPGWDDADGCFTGSAVDDNGTATILYTGVKSVAPQSATLRDGAHNFREVQCLATSTDAQLRTWSKWKTPVVQPPDDPQITGFRDPFLWRERDMWYLGVGSGRRKQGGQILLYGSRDLRQWQYLHPLATGKWSEREDTNPVDSGEMWECPDFFPLGSKHVLLYSTARKVIWEVGELDPKELVFHPQQSGVLDHGAYYAQKTQFDAKGRRILWGWIPEKRPEAEFSAAGWAGCMALPRVLSLNNDGHLEMRIAPEAESLRAKALASVSPAMPSEARAKALAALEIDNLAGELLWQTGAGPFSMTIADDAGPWWVLKVETPGSAVRLEVNGRKIDVLAQGSRTMDFRLVLDGSVAEFVCSSLHVLTSRIYRKPAGSLRLQLSGADARRVRSLQAWNLRPISADRLTT
ncbi:MAG TPA: glycoside hydrolase family 32 protein [Candidatus Eisenbacteria bacterium]|nr:glycoside hydrolase family 32 protein [Candidatus Eisenbacteria bacterium]